MATDNIINPVSLPKSLAADPVMGMVMGESGDYTKKVADIGTRRTSAEAPINADIQTKSKELQSMSEKGPEKVALPTNQAKHMTPEDMSSAFTTFMALGALGGLLTRQPMTAALNNMTAAMKGLHDGDQEQYKRATEEFNNNYSKAVATNKSKLDEYEKIFKNKESSIAEKVREATMIAKQYGDELTVANLQHGNMKDVFKNMEASQKTAVDAQNHKDTMDRFDKDRTARHDEHIATLGQQSAQLAETKRFHDIEAKHFEQTAGMKTGTLEYKLSEVSKLENQGVLTKEEAAKRKDTLLSGARGARIAEEKAYAQGIQLKLANKELEELERAGAKMPLAADIHIDGTGAISAISRLGQKKSLSSQEQQLLTAAQLYAEAAGHIQSGARLTQSAFNRAVNQFIQQPGDAPETKAMKKAHRDALEKGVGVLSGPLAGKESTPSSAPAPHQPYTDSEKEARYQKWKAEHAQ